MSNVFAPKLLNTKLDTYNRVTRENDNSISLQGDICKMFPFVIEATHNLLGRGNVQISSEIGEIISKYYVSFIIMCPPNTITKKNQNFIENLCIIKRVQNGGNEAKVNIFREAIKSNPLITRFQTFINYYIGKLNTEASIEKSTSIWVFPIAFKCLHQNHEDILDHLKSQNQFLGSFLLHQGYNLTNQKLPSLESMNQNSILAIINCLQFKSKKYRKSVYQEINSEFIKQIGLICKHKKDCDFHYQGVIGRLYLGGNEDKTNSNLNIYKRILFVANSLKNRGQSAFSNKCDGFIYEELLDYVEAHISEFDLDPLKVRKIKEIIRDSTKDSKGNIYYKVGSEELPNPFKEVPLIDIDNCLCLFHHGENHNLSCKAQDFGVDFFKSLIYNFIMAQTLYSDKEQFVVHSTLLKHFMMHHITFYKGLNNNQCSRIETLFKSKLGTFLKTSIFKNSFTKISEDRAPTVFRFKVSPNSISPYSKL